MRGSERIEAERQTKEELLAQCELLQSCSSRDTASGRTLEGAGAILAPAGNIRSDFRLENYFSRKITLFPRLQTAPSIVEEA